MNATLYEALELMQRNYTVKVTVGDWRLIDVDMEQSAEQHPMDDMLVCNFAGIGSAAKATESLSGETPCNVEGPDVAAGLAILRQEAQAAMCMAISEQIRRNAGL